MLIAVGADESKASQRCFPIEAASLCKYMDFNYCHMVKR